MGARCRPLLRDPIARHFSIKAMEILRGDAAGAPHGAHHMAAGAASRVDDCALKLVFFVRAALTAHALLTLHPLTPRRSPLHRAAAPCTAPQPLPPRGSPSPRGAPWPGGLATPHLTTPHARARWSSRCARARS